MHPYRLEFFDSDNDDNELAWQAPIHTLEDKSANPEVALTASNLENQQYEQLHRAMKLLDERSQLIIQHRWLNEEKSTLQDLSTLLNVSLERVRQLENNALKKMRSQFAANL